MDADVLICHDRKGTFVPDAEGRQQSRFQLLKIGLTQFATPRTEFQTATWVIARCEKFGGMWDG